MKAITLYIGLDVHKDSIVIAVAQAGPKGEIRLFGTITNDLHALEKALQRIRKAHPGAILEIAYEAGPCGFVIARRLQQLKVPCLVAAPSLIPKQPGAPFKTDKRDARGLARLLRAGELTAVYVPESTDEAVTSAALAPTRSMITAVAGIVSKAFSCVTVSAIKARPIGANPTCVTCASWSCPTPL